MKLSEEHLQQLANTHSHLRSIKAFIKKVGIEYGKSAEFLSKETKKIRENADVFNMFNSFISVNQDVLSSLSKLMMKRKETFLNHHKNLKEFGSSIKSKTPQLKKTLISVHKKGNDLVDYSTELERYDQINKEIVNQVFVSVKFIAGELNEFSHNLIKSPYVECEELQAQLMQLKKKYEEIQAFDRKNNADQTVQAHLKHMESEVLEFAKKDTKITGLTEEIDAKDKSYMKLEYKMSAPLSTSRIDKLPDDLKNIDLLKERIMKMINDKD